MATSAIVHNLTSLASAPFDRIGSNGTPFTTGPDFIHVGQDGAIEHRSGSAGFLRLKGREQLIRYAAALLRSDRDELRFVSADNNGRWLSVLLRVESEAKVPRVRLQAEAMAPAYGLTLRELDVLTLIAAGFGNDAIAARLTISARTICKHVENIFTKTTIRTRAGLASMATDCGLLRLPTPGGCDSYPLGTGMIERLALAPDKHPAPSHRSLTQRPILIGMPLALDGRGSADASEMLNGAIIAVEQINERGGVNGRELQLVTANAETNKAASWLQAYEKLIDAEVDAITAGYSCVEPSIHTLVSEFGGPYLHAATMESVVQSVRDDFSRLGNIFQVCASDVNYGLGIRRFLDNLEASGRWQPRNRKIAVLQPFWPGLDLGLHQLDRGHGCNSWQIELIKGLPCEGGDWHHVMDRLHRLDPTVVVLASYFVEDSIALQKAFTARPIASLLYKLYSPSIPQYRNELGHLADGVVWATMTGLYADRLGKQFSLKYHQRFGRDPGQSHASIAYDRVNILAGAWARVGSSRLFGKVVDDLRTTIHRGVNGSYYFGSEGQVGLAFPDDTQDPSLSQAHLVFQIQNGEQRILSPQPYSNAHFSMPSWLGG